MYVVLNLADFLLDSSQISFIQLIFIFCDLSDKLSGLNKLSQTKLSSIKLIRSIVQIIVVSLLSLRNVWRWPFHRLPRLLIRTWTWRLCERWIEFPSELLEFLQIHACHRFSRWFQCLLKVLSSYFRNRIKVLSLSSFLNQCLHPYLSFDWLNLA